MPPYACFRLTLSCSCITFWLTVCSVRDLVLRDVVLAAPVAAVALIRAAALAAVTTTAAATADLGLRSAVISVHQVTPPLATVAAVYTPPQGRLTIALSQKTK